MEVWQGNFCPLGATYDGAGTNFAIFSEVAEKVELSLFDDGGHETRVVLPEVSGFVWHGYLPRVQPGQRYGFRVHGPHDPAGGHRCNPNKLLLDPYARAVQGSVRWDPAVYGHRRDAPNEIEESDSAPYVPRSVVVNPFFEWGHDRPPVIPWHDTIIYELHVKGFTQLHPEIPEDLRGTYAGLAHPVAIDYLKSLGITAVELMPTHQFIHDHRLVERGLRNYWGYNSIGYFAPHNEYSSTDDIGGQVQEFKAMVKSLHEAGIEVILDVVYNHTAEGDHLGPTICFRGIDNASYYRLSPDDPSRYLDFTGCGNSMNMSQPFVLQLIMDSLRYWVQEMHVDGFRFDLAAALARELHDVDRLSAFFDIIHQDPVLNRVKLIAEPWDLGRGGYQVGRFPSLWSEWNGKYRDTVRDFWRGEDQKLPVLAHRLTGSSDLYASSGRRPYASINFVTCHDGFTLRDLVSYNGKHNEGNGEHNQDGENHNRSWNCAMEGETDDPSVNALRGRQQRNLLATLFFSQGVPMLLAGDELGRTQQGNNNAYCQDNGVSWVQWDDVDEALLEFTRRMILLRKQHPVFRRRRWFHGRPIHHTGRSDIAWFKPDGQQMTVADWEASFAKALGVVLYGDGIASPDSHGRHLVDDDFILLLNAHDAALEFWLPDTLRDREWRALVDTGVTPAGQQGETRTGCLRVEQRSLVLIHHAR